MRFGDTILLRGFEKVGVIFQLPTPPVILAGANPPRKNVDVGIAG
jgi:hypothetical protein